MATKTEIIQFFSEMTVDSGFTDKLKVRYRPLICPFDELLAYANTSTSAFDIGCGSGQFCALLAKYSPVSKIFGIEISNTLVENAREITLAFQSKKNLHFETFDGTNIPDEIVQYDIIFLIDVLHHVPKKQQTSFLQSIYSKIKPGAKLILKDIDANHPFVLFNKLHDLVLSKEIGNEWSAKKARAFASEVGFKILEERKKRMFVYPHYFLILEK